MASKEWKEEHADDMRRWRREYYYRNKERELARIRQNTARKRKELREWFVEYKSKLVCLKCNESDWTCLDFHHVDSKTKSMTISLMVGRQHSKENIMAEIAKCVVLCANCHRKVHQMGWVPAHS